MIDYANFCTKYSQLSSIPSSPERRCRATSPCRRLFDEFTAAISNRPANQNYTIPSNASNMTTNPSSSLRPINCLDTIDLIGNNNCNNNCSTATTTSSLSLSEGIALGYQRRKNIHFPTATKDHHSLQGNGSVASSFMDDLGFLSSSSANQNMSKKLALAQYDENVNDCINAMTSSDPVVVFSHPSSALDTASPMKSPRRSNSIVMTPSQLFQMRPCSVTKKTSSHWTKRGPIPSTNKVIQPKQLRRTVSEFPRPCSATTATESGNGMIHSLPCFDSLKDAIKRIDPVTLVDVLDGTISGSFEKLVVVDCRYPYEYVGGHIPGAINVNTPDQIEHLLFDSTSEFVGKKVAIVFHCEFSSERAPRMALHVRSYDRELNTANYPSLCYPEMYILDGGYKNFWKQFGERCEPPNAYVPMRNPFFKEELKLHQRAKYAFRSGTHLSQHSVVKTSHPAKRSRSLQPQEANRIFDDLLDCINRPDTNDLFPSHAISQSKSLSSILPSELDFPSEMDTEE